MFSFTNLFCIVFCFSCDFNKIFKLQFRLGFFIQIKSICFFTIIKLTIPFRRSETEWPIFLPAINWARSVSKIDLF